MIRYKRQFNKPVIPSNVLGWRQEGGDMVPSGEPAMADQEQVSPEQVLAELAPMAQEAIETQNAEMAMQICQIIAQFGETGAEPPMEEAAMEEAPTEAMKKGGEFDY